MVLGKTINIISRGFANFAEPRKEEEQEEEEVVFCSRFTSHTYYKHT